MKNGGGQSRRDVRDSGWRSAVHNRRAHFVEYNIHQKAWPTVENTLSNKSDYPVLLFDEV